MSSSSLIIISLCVSLLRSGQNYPTSSSAKILITYSIGISNYPNNYPIKMASTL